MSYDGESIPEVLRERLRSDAGWFSGQKGPLASSEEGAGVPNFSVSRSEGLEHLFQSSSGFGLIPMVPVAGRPSLRRVLGLTGMELMFIRVLPGDSSPFPMRHRRDEVAYIVVSGLGQFLIDDEFVDVTPGTVLRVSPTAVRAWRNPGVEDLCLIVVQSRARRSVRKAVSDAIGLPRRIVWPSRRSGQAGG